MVKPGKQNQPVNLHATQLLRIGVEMFKPFQMCYSLGLCTRNSMAYEETSIL